VTLDRETEERIEQPVSLEATAQAGLAIGGTELETAERSARTLIREAPYRESGYRLLIEVLARWRTAPINSVNRATHF